MRIMCLFLFSALSYQGQCFQIFEIFSPLRQHQKNEVLGKFQRTFSHQGQAPLVLYFDLKISQLFDTAGFLFYYQMKLEFFPLFCLFSYWCESFYLNKQTILSKDFVRVKLQGNFPFNIQFFEINKIQCLTIISYLKQDKLINNDLIISSICKIKTKTIMKQQGKYFRVLGKNHSLPPIQSFSSNPQELTQHIIKNKYYLYIDLSEQTGLKQMEAISADDAELDTERVGGNYVCNLRALSIQTQKAIDYLHKASNLQKLKDKYRDLLKREFSNRVSRASIKGRSKIGRRQKKPLKQKKTLETVTIYRGMNSNKLKTIIENRELQRKNQIILEKQKFLISKFGITNEYQTITNPKEKYPIIRKNGKVVLPGLKNTERTAYDTLQ